MLEIHCPKCHRKISASDVNLATMVACCTDCDELFEVTVTPSKPEIGQPSSLEVLKQGSQFSIIRSWYNPGLFFMTFFCIFWDGFLIFWYAAALSAEKIDIAALLFPLFHVAVGVGLTYTTIAGFLNKTTISLAKGQLNLTHGPLPWRGNLTFASSDLKQFFTLEHVGSKGTRRYELCALMKDGRRVSVLTGLGRSDEVLFIEQQLEQHLGIVDQPVAGEYKA